MIEITTALIKAKANFKTPKRTKQGYGYKYAPMDEVLAATEPELSFYGLFISQHIISEGGMIGIMSSIRHSLSGEEISSAFYWPVEKKDPQSLGSAITYFRRYAYMAILGLAPEDDDGQSHTDKKVVINTNGAKSITPTDKMKKFYASLLNTKYNSDIPEDVISSAKNMSLGDMSEAINTLKSELGL